MRVAIVQMTSSNHLESNLEKMKARAQEAAGQGAKLVAFPEMAYFMGRAEQWADLLPRFKEIAQTFGEWAAKLGIWLLPGTLREPSSGGRYYNTQLVFDDRGKQAAAYRKIFLFKATLPDRAYDEARFCDPGGQITCFTGPGVTIGLSICYDLRFPELFRALKNRGAQCLVIPASFTVPTGMAHWETLLRTRAIENQVFVLAPAQAGEVGDGARTYGNSLIVSPWGEILARLSEGEGIASADLDLQQLAEAAGKVDCLALAARRLVSLRMIV